MKKKSSEQWIIAGILISGVVALWARAAMAGPPPVPPEPPK